MRVGFVGLGVMGAPMAGHLRAAGQDLVVWNRTVAKSQPLANQGARVARSLRQVGSECDVVFLCVARSEDVDECLEGLVPEAKPGTLFVDHSTIAPASAAKLHVKLRGQGLRFLDAPVTGGSMGAQKGQLTIFVGGDREDFDRASSLMAPYVKRCELVGGGERDKR